MATENTEQTITLDDLVRAVSTSTGMSQAVVRRVTRSFVNEIADRLADGTEVQIKGLLGAFKQKDIRSHYKKGLNFGEREIVQKRYTQIYFVASDKIYAKLNSKLNKHTQG